MSPKFEQVEPNEQFRKQYSLTIAHNGVECQLDFDSKYEAACILKEHYSDVPPNIYDHYLQMLSGVNAPVLTNNEVANLSTNPPLGYTLEEYMAENNGLNTLAHPEDPVTLEYTLTFGTGWGKERTHSSEEFKGLYIIYSLDPNKTEYYPRLNMWRHMQYDYNVLSSYAYYKPNMSDAERQVAVARIRAFRSVHSWVYDNLAEQRKSKLKSKKFTIQ